MSLSEVANRAGTSPASLSRYENGWTRFETYTLRKLAVALGCKLHVELQPISRITDGRASCSDLITRLQRLFWDHTLTRKVINQYPVWLLERVLDYGNLEDVYAVQKYMGSKNFLHKAAKAERVSPKTRNFWKQVLEKEGIPCMKKSSRNTAWNS
ncbi:MAG: hypothetical protein A2498_04225 [Lentisphaerae bacterium RIFOXYC12_FULL_60_16]|nr:MAG: hypothetical protein A2498_04225 [Lentisphaerae bacterium RIFOXYC12_FULL_60_16]